MKRLYSVTIIAVLIMILSGCGNLLSYEQIEQIKQKAVEDAKEDILEENALDYVRENYTPEEVYPDKVILNRGKAYARSQIHGTMPQMEGGYDEYYIINKSSKVFHSPDCPSVDQMKQKNKIMKYSTPEKLISEGYKPCGNEEW